MAVVFRQADLLYTTFPATTNSQVALAFANST